METLTPEQVAHFAWWSKRGTVVRTQREAVQAIRMCLDCQDIALALKDALYGCKR